MWGVQRFGGFSPSFDQGSPPDTSDIDSDNSQVSFCDSNSECHCSAEDGGWDSYEKSRKAYQANYYSDSGQYVSSCHTSECHSSSGDDRWASDLESSEDDQADDCSEAYARIEDSRLQEKASRTWYSLGNKQADGVDVAKACLELPPECVIQLINKAPKLGDCTAAQKQALCFAVRVHDISERCIDSNRKVQKAFSTIMRHQLPANKVTEISCEMIERVSEASCEAKYLAVKRLQEVAISMLDTKKTTHMSFGFFKDYIKSLVQHGAFSLATECISGRSVGVNKLWWHKNEAIKMGQEYLASIKVDKVRYEQQDAFNHFRQVLSRLN